MIAELPRITRRRLVWISLAVTAFIAISVMINAAASNAADDDAERYAEAVQAAISKMSPDSTPLQLYGELVSRGFTAPGEALHGTDQEAELAFEHQVVVAWQVRCVLVRFIPPNAKVEIRQSACP